MKFRLTFLNLCIVCLLLLASRAVATVYYVNVSNTVSVSPFASWATAATNIQDAIDASADGDLILVTNGVYKSGGSVVYGSLTNRVVVNKFVTVQSVNGPAKTLIVGNRTLNNSGVRCVYLTNNAELIGFTLTNGATRGAGDVFEEQAGGGVWCESTSAIVSNCVITANSGNYGGGSFSGTLINSTLTNNLASFRGGGALGGYLINCILITNNSPNGAGACSNFLYGCTLKGNLATQSGGGAYSSTLTNCVLAGNLATNGGGAIYGTLAGCTLTNNSAGNGGGACSNILIGCLLTHNLAMTNGGGAFSCTMSNCTLTGNNANGGDNARGGGACGGILNNCLILSNSAATSGGGIISNVANYCTLFGNFASDGGAAYGATLNACILSSNIASVTAGGSYGSALNNCLIINNYMITPFTAGTPGAYNCNLTNCTVVGNPAAAGNSAVSGFGTACVNSIIYSNTGINYSGGNCYNCCSTPLPPGSNNFTNAPIFVDGRYHLQTNSPCIDAGNTSMVSGSFDLDGRPRLVGAAVDVGATEFQGASMEPFISWLYKYGLPNDGSADYADSDGTGMNNWQKWIAGLNPINRLSVLAMSSAVLTNNPPGMAVAWQSVTNVTYYLQRSADLKIFTSIQSNLVGQAGITRFADTAATNGGPYYYRVGVQQ